MALVTTPEAREKRFWALVNKSGDEDCWLWMGAKNQSGYGNVQTYPDGRKKAIAAHRVSYQYAHGPFPDWLCVLHKCDVRACVNPAHLFLGTRSDNNADKVAKGRQPTNSGETNPRAKLSKENALDIMKMINAGVSQVEIARMFGVHQTQISRVKRGYLVDA